MNENRYLRWLSSKTQSVFWHDSAVKTEQAEAFSNGAAGMTTNPFLVNSTLRNDTAFWKERLSALPKGLKGDEKVLALVRCVTGYYSDLMMPMYEQGIPGKGYVCAQTNPNKTGDAEYMIAQAKTISSWAPNIVVKLPATRSGIEAYEECTALGMNVAATVSFTVPQVLAVGEARARGKARAERNGIKPGLGIAVVMVGRLDDYLRDFACDSHPEVSEECIVKAGTACIKRAYGIFKERGYDAFLMPAGCRGANHITDLAGAKMIMSIAPKIADMLKDVEVFEERIEVPVNAGIIDSLMKMSEFRRAYEPDGMKPEEFITFGSSNRTTAQFIECGWNPLSAFDYESL
ncbi:MAG: Transaldolase [Firmicutes bacterium ADurb.Bin182]|nr:MAG: Transaldolase [Firmicutes bacterium ADurb.Bin182]